MRIALIGLGDIAQKAYLPLLTTDERVTPLICTRNPQVLSELARRYRIAECFTDVNELLSTRPDGVMIHAATSAHAEIAQKSLLAGIPTFVDKPLCDNLKEAEALCQLSLTRNCPLFVGFNRRYLPAMSAALEQPLTELNWQKHRYALPGIIQTFLFDDFIHVLDSLCFYGGIPEGDIHAVLRHCPKDPNMLAGISVSWQSGNKAISGSMNRSAGITEERISCFADNLSLHLESLSRATIARDALVHPLIPDDWQATLEQRGFVAMLNHWYQQIEKGKADSELINSYLHGHRLADQLVSLATAQLKQIP